MKYIPKETRSKRIIYLTLIIQCIGIIVTTWLAFCFVKPIANSDSILFLSVSISSIFVALVGSYLGNREIDLKRYRTHLRHELINQSELIDRFRHAVSYIKGNDSLWGDRIGEIVAFCKKAPDLTVLEYNSHKRENTGTSSGQKSFPGALSAYLAARELMLIKEIFGLRDPHTTKRQYQRREIQHFKQLCELIFLHFNKNESELARKKGVLYIFIQEEFNLIMNRPIDMSNSVQELVTFLRFAFEHILDKAELNAELYEQKDPPQLSILIFNIATLTFFILLTVFTYFLPNIDLSLLMKVRVNWTDISSKISWLFVTLIASGLFFTVISTVRSLIILAKNERREIGD